MGTAQTVFVPSRGFLFFYLNVEALFSSPVFSSPHGDFSFSILIPSHLRHYCRLVFVPSRGFLFFYPFLVTPLNDFFNVFVPSRGFLFFYDRINLTVPKGDVFVPSRGFLFFYWHPLPSSFLLPCFRPLTGISLFLSYLIFPL